MKPLQSALVLATALTLGVPQAHGLALHGNYCGPDHNRWDLPPVSAIDASCRNHDLCYLRPGGVDACVCDHYLIQDAKNILRYCQDNAGPQYLPCGKEFAQFLILGMAFKPCQSNHAINPQGQEGSYWPLGQGLITH
ncbi:MAG: hypothetical protein HQL74_05645 [Magnetococcales bacterium]|nr:hypothetical protein [Magnetococcales bacterium]